MHGVGGVGTRRKVGAHLRAIGGPCCLGDGRQWLSGADVADRIDAGVDAFGPGRRLVALAAEPTVEFVVDYLAALDAGHTVLVGADDTLGRLVDHYDPDSVGTQLRRATPARDLHPDLALLLSTSGSTGSPKLVRLSQRNLVANARSIAEYLDLGPDDCGVSTLPLHYCYGLSVLHSHLVAGAAMLLTPNSVVDPCLWNDMARHGVTNLAGVPHTFDLIERVGVECLALPDLRFVTQAGGALPPERVRRFAELGDRYGWDFVVMYGQTEATARMAYLPPELAHRHPDAVGVAVPGGSFELRGLDGDDPGAGEIGRVVYRGPNVMMGYATAPADLARGPELSELVTGDLGTIDASGLLRVVGREARFAKLFGLRIDLDGVQSHLADLGWSALVASDDCRLAVLVENRVGQPPLDDVAAAVASLVGIPETGVHVASVGSLPRLSTGKPDVAGVLDAVPEPDAGDDDVDGGDTVADAYRRVLGVAEVTSTDTFAGLGGDSLNYVELSLRLEKIVGRLPDGWQHMAVADLQARARPAPRLVAHVDTTVVLRAVAISAVVVTHMSWFDLTFGAHLLLAVAGYNFARFQLDDTHRRGWLQTAARPFAKIAALGSAWVALQMAIWGEHSLATVLLVNSYLGDPAHTGLRWRYWYIEAIVHIAIGVMVLLASRRVRRLEARHRFWFPVALLVPTLALRFEAVNLGDPARNSIFQADTVAWLFVIGWIVARATTRWQRGAVTAVVVASVPGYFFHDDRSLRLAVGLLVLVWVRQIPVPRGLHRLVGWVAGASLAIYLTHYAVFPRLDDHLSAPWVFSITMAVGVLAWMAGVRLCERVRVARRVVAPGASTPPPLGPGRPSPAQAAELVAGGRGAGPT